MPIAVVTSVKVPSRLLWKSRAIAAQVVEEQVGVVVVVVVDPGGTLAERVTGSRHAGLRGDLLERAVARLW